MSTETLTAPPENAVVKLSVTEIMIAEFKEKYLGLTINGIDDKEGFKKVFDSRQVVKKARVGVEKEAKKMKEDAIAWQKKVNAAQNKVVGELEEIEAYLQQQEDKIEAEKERIRLEAEAAEKARIQKRIDRLAEYGFAVDYNLLIGLSDESFEKVVDNAKQEHEKELAAKAEAARLLKEEEDRIQAEKEAEALRMKQEREELDRQKKEQEEQAAALKAQQDKLIEDQKRLSDNRRNHRCDQLFALGLKFNGQSYVFKDVNVHYTELTTLEETEWNKLTEEIKPVIVQRKKEDEQRLADEQAEADRIEKARIEQLQKDAAEKALADQKEKDRIEKEAEAERIAQASDKVKFQELLKQLQGVTIPVMKSKKAEKIAKEVGEIVNNGILHINNSFLKS